MNNFKKVTFFILLLSFCSTALALRCGNQIISIGDSTSKVLQACGKPSEKSVLGKKARNKFQAHSKRIQWTYNFGSHDFVYLLIFENGKLREIETNGYGH